ncbi:MAG: RNA methyltransferase, partial [Dokdonella sp.]
MLVRTSHPGNIGASARAMRTMGLQRMELVAPHSFPHSEATALAAGADMVLENARLSDDLATAINDCQFAIGATARRRGVQLPEFDPRAAAAQVLDIARKGGEVALVFGNERTGLSNDELQL